MPDHPSMAPGAAGAVHIPGRDTPAPHPCPPLSDAQWRGIFEAAGEAILTVDLTRTVVSANPAAAAMLGVTLDELLGSPLSRWVPERYRASHERLVSQFVDSRRPAVPMDQRRGFMARRADGEEFPVAAGLSQVEVDGVRLFTVILCDLGAQQRAEAALRSSEQMLTAAFTASAAGMVRIDPASHRFTAANAAFCQLTGYDEAELLTLGMDDLAHPDDRLDRARLQALLAGTAPYRTDQRLVRKDGGIVWVALDSSVIRDRHGHPEAVLGVVQDITARREAEDVLRAREARQAFLLMLNDRLRLLAEPQAIIDEATRLLGTHTGAARVGYAEDDDDGEHITVVHNFVDGVPDIEGRHRYDDYGPALLPALRDGRTVVRPDVARDPTLGAAEQAAHAALQVGATVNVPLLKDGRIKAVFFVHARAARAWTPEEVSLYEEVAERLRADVERARAEARLQASRTTLETALESMTDAVMITDAAGNLLTFNAGFAAFHRFASKAAVPRSMEGLRRLLEVLDPSGQPMPLDQHPVQRALRGEVVAHDECGLRRTDTGERWTASFSFAPVRAADGHIAGAVVVGRDLTAWQGIHRRLQEAHDELQRLAAARDRAQEDERQRIARELHDGLLQSLAQIAIDASTAGNDLARAPDAARAALQQIVHAAEQSIAATRRIILDLRPQILEDLGLPAALQDLARRFAQRTRVACRVDVATHETTGVDRELGALGTSLYRMAQEALNNVGRHAGARSVRIALADAPGQRLRLTVADDGQGMDLQAPRATESFGLLGMRERVRALGGTLAIDSAPGQGTRIDIEVPLPAAPATPPGAAPP